MGFEKVVNRLIPKLSSPNATINLRFNKPKIYKKLIILAILGSIYTNKKYVLIVVKTAWSSSLSVRGQR